MAKRKPKDHDDAFAHAAAFAEPIYRKIRSAMHKACPDVVESIKWSSPFFEHEGILAGVMPFKAHINFTFWRGMQMKSGKGLLEKVGDTGMGMMRLETESDVPPARTLQAMVKEAVKLNIAAKAEGCAPTGKLGPRKKASAVKAPADLMAALKRKKKALATFEGFTYSKRKEYVGWITEAKREETRSKRVAQAVEWMAEGKPRNWKYMKEWK